MATKPIKPRAAPLTAINQNIYLIRGQKVMISNTLADLYEVEHRTLIQAVHRNAKRFPEDFMFQLTADEWRNWQENLKSQFVISSETSWGGARKPPYAFTEQGIAMLSGVLRSERAIEVNIGIMRAFVQLRQMLLQNRELSKNWQFWRKNMTKTLKWCFPPSAN